MDGMAWQDDAWKEEEEEETTPILLFPFSSYIVASSVKKGRDEGGILSLQ